MNPPSHRFVWHDLMSAEPDRSHRFYADLLGWTAEEQNLGELGVYRALRAGDRPVGGIVPLDPLHRMPNHWLGYVWADDVDAAAARAQQLGGRVPVPPRDIPEVGRFAVIMDPHGAPHSSFSPLRSPERSGAADAAPGTFCWDELLTPDVPGATKFYAGVHGWQLKEEPVAELGSYMLWMDAGDEVAGMMAKPPDAAGPAVWLSYVAVEDAEETVERAQGLAARIFVPPTEIPSVGRFAVLADPTGALFGLLQRGRS